MVHSSSGHAVILLFLTVCFAIFHCPVPSLITNRMRSWRSQRPGYGSVEGCCVPVEAGAACPADPGQRPQSVQWIWGVGAWLQARHSPSSGAVLDQTHPGAVAERWGPPGKSHHVVQWGCAVDDSHEFSFSSSVTRIFYLVIMQFQTSMTFCLFFFCFLFIDFLSPQMVNLWMSLKQLFSTQWASLKSHGLMWRSRTKIFNNSVSMYWL